MKYKCHDCGRELKTKNGKLVNGYFLEYPLENYKNIKIIKCKKCYNEKKYLSDYQPCEVYNKI